MTRALRGLLGWAAVAVLVGASTTTADAEPQPQPQPPENHDRDVVFPDADAPPKCCVPPRDYGARTTFVPEMFRSVEEL